MEENRSRQPSSIDLWLTGKERRWVNKFGHIDCSDPRQRSKGAVACSLNSEHISSTDWLADSDKNCNETTHQMEDKRNLAFHQIIAGHLQRLKKLNSSNGGKFYSKPWQDKSHVCYFYYFTTAPLFLLNLKEWDESSASLLIPLSWTNNGPDWPPNRIVHLHLD